MRFTTCIQLLFLSVLFVQCNPEKAPAITCENGFEPEGSECVCPQGKYEAYGICRALEEGELYGRTPADCPCSRGIFLKIVEKSGTSTLKEVRIRTMGPQGAPVESILYCIAQPDGDSIFGDYSPHYFCARDNYYFWVHASGKLVRSDSLRMRLHFTPVAFTPGTILPPQDSFEFWLTRQ